MVSLVWDGRGSRLLSGQASAVRLAFQPVVAMEAGWLVAPMSRYRLLKMRGFELRDVTTAADRALTQILLVAVGEGGFMTNCVYDVYYTSIRLKVKPYYVMYRLPYQHGNKQRNVLFFL